MPSPDVQRGVAALLEQCAQRRAGALALACPDQPAHVARMLQAEAAGRELMAALIRPDPFPDLSLGACLRRLVGYLQTVISASTPDDQPTPLLSARVHHAAVSAESARLLCDAALLLVLAAIDDEAGDVEIRLERGDGGARLSIESDRPVGRRGSARATGACADRRRRLERSARAAWRKRDRQRDDAN